MKKIVSILMLFVMIFAGAHLVVALHFCGDDLHSVAITQDADNCCEDEPMTSNVHSTAFHEKGCCRTNDVAYSTDNYNPIHPLVIQHLNFLPVILLWNTSEVLSLSSSMTDTRLNQAYFPPGGYFRENNDLLTYIRTFII